MGIKIPISDLKKQIAPIRAEIDAAMARVIDNTNFILGKEVGELECAVAEYTGVKYAVGVSNGTDALRLALLALGISRGDGVLCPSFTYYATAGAVASIGAIPVFADIDPDTYNISAQTIKKILAAKPQKLQVKAIIAVHLYGQCADMDPILEIARKNGLKVVEDTAQAFGAEYKGRKAASLGDCGAVSFFPGKNLGAFGDAGMVLTSDQDLAEKIKLLRNQGNDKKYIHSVLGSNNRLDTIQAAVLGVKLKYLDGWNNGRIENAGYFNRTLNLAGLKTPFAAQYNKHIYHQYVLRVSGSNSALLEHLKGKGIDCRVYYPIPLHLQECFKYLGYQQGDFPESERASNEVLAIPVYPDLTRQEMDYIVSSIKEFLK